MYRLPFLIICLRFSGARPKFRDVCADLLGIVRAPQGFRVSKKTTGGIVTFYSVENNNKKKKRTISRSKYKYLVKYVIDHRRVYVYGAFGAFQGQQVFLKQNMTGSYLIFKLTCDDMFKLLTGEIQIIEFRNLKSDINRKSRFRILKSGFFPQLKFRFSNL